MNIIQHIAVTAGMAILLVMTWSAILHTHRRKRRQRDRERILRNRL